MSENQELSERENDVLLLVATGASNKEIANQLNISINTVKVHIRNIFTKIEATSRTEAAMFAVNMGLLPDIPPVETPPQIATSSPQSANSASNNAPTSLPVLGRRLFQFVIIAILLVTVLWVFFALGRTENNEEPSIAGQDLPANSQGWLMLSPLPRARYSLGVVAYENQIFAIGGMTDAGVTGRVDIYDPTINQWTPGKAKPVAVKDIQAAVMGGKIYVPGGETSQQKITSQLEIYNPRMDLWTLGAPMPKAISAYALAAFDGRMYLFGGWDGENILDHAYRYDPEQDSWEALPPMPTARRYLGAAVSGRRIYLLGGENENGALEVNEFFLPDQGEIPENTWQTGISLPESIFGLSATSVADIIYIVGGSGNSTRQYSVLAYDQTSGWGNIMAQPDDKISFPGLANLGTFLFIIGGQVDQSPSGDAYSYQAVYTLSFPVIVR